MFLSKLGSQKNLIYLAFGPLTNLAFGFKLNPGMKETFQHIFICGGAHQYFGTQSYSTDFNFHYDYQAASVILRCFKNIILLPIEPTFYFTNKAK